MKPVTFQTSLRALAILAFSTAILLSIALSKEIGATAAVFTLAETVAAPALTITPITWGVVGLDSNNVTVGPNVFPIGARVCNIGDMAATNLQSAFVWDSANNLIAIRTGSSTSLTHPSLVAGECTDFYYEIEVTRSASAFDTARRFHITSTADGIGGVSTPTPRELYVERLISQNRNSVTSIKLNGGNVPFGGTMNLAVGNTYTIELNASTATNGYEQIESFIGLPNVIFQTLSVSSTYTAPTGYTGNRLYEDACGWDPDPISPDYRSCIGPQNVPGGKAGGKVTLQYTVKVLAGSGTSQTLNTLIYDFSGSSYHYNSDYSATSVIAQISPPTTAARVSLQGRVILQAGNGIRNVRVTITEQDGTTHSALTGSFGYYRFDDIQAGQSVLVSVASRRYTFSQPVRVVTLIDDLTYFDFVAE